MVDHSQKAKAELAKRELARRHFQNFVDYTKPDYDFNWHHVFMCQKLQDFADKKIKRLMIFMPPRHGKSELVSRRLPAYILGKDRDAQIIATSYGADLAKDMNRDVQGIMEDNLYTNVFPGSAIPGSNTVTVAKGSRLRNSETFQLADPKTRGKYTCAGVGGPITGKGADYAIIDDPIKNDKEADSPTYRNGINKWYGSTLYTRLEKAGSVLLTLTRWHEDDLAGRLKDLMVKNGDADKWEIIEFPAIKEDNSNPDDPREIGEALWPGKYPLEILKKIKATIGSRWWAALYQQRPAPDEGGMFPIHCWKYTDTPPQIVEMVRYWDRAATAGGGDWTVGVLMGKCANGFYYVLDVVRLQGAPHEVEATIKSTAQKDGRDIPVWLEEDPGQAGKFETSYYIRALAGYDVKACSVREGKATRARPYSAQVNAGNVYLVRGQWNNEYTSEHATFPHGSHDDQVDASSGAFKQLSDDFVFLI